jgi:hypothetical protein
MRAEVRRSKGIGQSLRRLLELPHHVVPRLDLVIRDGIEVCQKAVGAFFGPARVRGDEVSGHRALALTRCVLRKV